MPKKKLTRFGNEDEEREFWSNHASAGYVDWRKSERIAFSDLKPSTRPHAFRQSIRGHSARRSRVERKVRISSVNPPKSRYPCRMFPMSRRSSTIQ